MYACWAISVKSSTAKYARLMVAYHAHKVLRIATIQAFDDVKSKKKKLGFFVYFVLVVRAIQIF